MTSKTDRRRIGLEKMLRYVLGTAPDEFGLSPDSGGYVPLKALAAALRDEEGWRALREGDIAALLNQPGNLSPFEMADGLIRLKAATWSPEPPKEESLPKNLYAAFKPAAWAVISRRGLYPKPGEEKIRLWSEAELALKVGRRVSAEAVLVTVAAHRARQAGVVFRPYSERLWLTAEVPADFLNGPPVPEEAERPAKKIKKLPEPLYPGPAAEPEISRGKKKGRGGDSPDWKNQSRRERRRRREDF